MPDHRATQVPCVRRSRVKVVAAKSPLGEVRHPRRCARGAAWCRFPPLSAYLALPLERRAAHHRTAGRALSLARWWCEQLAWPPARRSFAPPGPSRQAERPPEQPFRGFNISFIQPAGWSCELLASHRRGFRLPSVQRALIGHRSLPAVERMRFARTRSPFVILAYRRRSCSLFHPCAGDAA